MRLPSLNALRAFEAAARHESFTRAAAELCVTEGAVSRHVKLLEEEIGITLFNRLTRKVELTDQGRELMAVAGSAFAGIAAGVTKIAAPRSGLKVACDRTLTIRWLMPRLERFRQRHPDVEVQLTADFLEREQLISGNYDIRLGSCERPEGFLQKFILAAHMTPACAPRLLRGRIPLRDPADIAHFAIIHSTPDRRDWKNWMRAFGPADCDIQRGQMFSSLDMAQRAAVMGEGIVIGDLTLMTEELERDELIIPFPDKVLRGADDDYRFFCRQESWEDWRVRAFHDWLIEESRPSDTLPPS